MTRLGRSITMTATGDEYTGIVFPLGINFQGTGLTAGQRILMTDSAGSVIADYITEGTSDNQDLLNGRTTCAQGYQGIKIASGTVAGTWVVTVILD
jgi:hypothetical protein